MNNPHRFSAELYNLTMIQIAKGKSVYPGDKVITRYIHLQNCSNCERINQNYINNEYPEDSKSRHFIKIGEGRIDEYLRTLDDKVFETF